jgi:hypothetical protein
MSCLGVDGVIYLDHATFEFMLLAWLFTCRACLFPNLKLTYMPPRAKYEQNDLFYNANTFVEFLQVLIL